MFYPGRLEICTVATSVRHWQPVEHKPFYHFQPGRLTLTLAVPGCTFRCDYCLNAALSQYRREPLATWSAEPLEPAKAVGAATQRGAAFALSYSEPGLAAEMPLALHRAALGIWVEISSPLIPGFNADAASILAMARRVAALGRDTPWHLVRFPPYIHRQDAVPTSPDALAGAVRIARMRVSAQ